MPLVKETFRAISKARWLIKLDVSAVYHRLRIKDGDEWKTAFKTRYSLFKYMVMLFSLTNTPAMFQAYIHKALSHLIDSICIMYLNDILIYSKDKKEHKKHIKIVLQRL